jgi:anti-sigma factor RsiW
MSCDATQQRLEQLADPSQLEALGDDERQHLASCDDCAAHHALLLELAAESVPMAVPALPPQLLATVERRAVHALRVAQQRRALRWDIAAPLAVALLALPIALGQGWLWLKGLAFVLGSWIPASVLTGLAVVHFISVALALGALYGAIPLVIAYVTPIRQEAS